ncbi:GumC family protein [Microbaculum sp. FT89]|uniref:GumC family protein n=1 Tax=Microbaculum sp. FT89 TaxID=3447298 RepID=UPI003F52DEE3
MPAHSRFADMPMAGQTVSAGGAPAGVSAGGLVSALWRARFWIVLPVIVATALAVLWLSGVTPLYRSTAKLLVENQETAYTRPSATVEERTLLDQESIRSQVQLILSADLSRKIIADLKLGALPEFNPDSAPSVFSRILSLFGVARDPTGMTNDEKVLDKYYERLTVYQVEQSRVIAVEFASENPELAARIANAIADGYIDMQKTAKRDATREASEWLKTQIDALRTKVDEAERAVEEYRTEHGLFSTLRGATQPQSLSGQQLSELTTQLALARAQKSEALAKARLIREMLEAGGPIESSEVLNSPLIQGLVSQQVQLRAQIAELSTTLGPRHPRMLQLNAQLGDLRKQIRDEAMKYARAAENDATVAAEREHELLANLDTLKATAAQSNENEVALRALERDAKSERDLLESLLARYRDATAREDVGSLPANARLISRAAPASEPYFPKTLATLLAAFLGSLVLACGIVITLELFRSVGEYPVGATSLPVPVRGGPAESPLTGSSGTGPDPGPAPGKRRVKDREPDTDAPRAVVEEPALTGFVGGPVKTGLDGIRDRILLNSSGDVAHTVLVTSVRDRSDTRKFAMRLARDVAGQGRRVVVVDTAFAEDKPGAEKKTAAEEKPAEEKPGEEKPGDGELGLGDLLMGNAAFETVIRRDEYSRVHAIAAGHTAADPLILLASDRMETVLEALRLTYDVVFLLAPAVIRHGEARLLAARADFALLLSSGAVGETASQRARDRLEAAGVEGVEVITIADNGDDPERTAA